MTPSGLKIIVYPDHTKPLPPLESSPLFFDCFSLHEWFWLVSLNVPLFTFAVIFFAVYSRFQESHFCSI